MSTRFRNLKNDLQDIENEVEGSSLGNNQNNSGGSNKTANYILLFAFIAVLVFYAGNRAFDVFQGFDNPISELQDAVQSFNDYDPELLQGMGEWMEDLGYGVLSNEELSDLRDEGVTATQTQALHDLGYTELSLDDLVTLQRADVSAGFISGFRELGYTELTLEDFADLRRGNVTAAYISEIRDAGYTETNLDQFIDLQRADVTATYASMMKGLGYDLTIDQLAQTRRNGVTAFFTSNMMDLGYTLEELTVENLIRMRSIGVDHETAADLMAERGERLSVDELIRYEISNQ